MLKVRLLVVFEVIVPDPPKATDTPLKVTLELVSEELPMFDRLLDAPLIVLFVRI